MKEELFVVQMERADIRIFELKIEALIRSNPKNRNDLKDSNHKMMKLINGK